MTYETNENRRNKQKVENISFVSSIFVCFVFPIGFRGQENEIKYAKYNHRLTRQ
jgi:hypothetical protein